VLAALLVALGGGLGSTARYLVGGWFAARLSSSFPYGTFFINVTGSFVIAFFLAFAEDRVWLGPNWRLFFAIGVVGGYTTFSTFEFESIRLLQDGEMLAGALYILGSVICGALGAIAGIALGSRL
jgi:CrcB protein